MKRKVWATLPAGYKGKLNLLKRAGFTQEQVFCWIIDYWLDPNHDDNGGGDEQIVISIPEDKFAELKELKKELDLSTSMILIEGIDKMLKATTLKPVETQAKKNYKRCLALFKQGKTDKQVESATGLSYPRITVLRRKAIAEGHKIPTSQEATKAHRTGGNQ